MKIKINEEKCIGCGVCASLCPKGIAILDGKAIVTDSNQECLKDAFNACPINAISIN